MALNGLACDCERDGILFSENSTSQVACKNGLACGALNFAAKALGYTINGNGEKQDEIRGVCNYICTCRSRSG